MAADRVTDEMIAMAWMAYTGRDKLGPDWADDLRCMLPTEKDAMRAALTAALRAEAGAVGWMPIESAPKDGTEVLCWDKSEALVPLVMHYSSADYFEKEYGDRDYMVEGWYLSYSYPDGMHEETCSPTHWQPLSPRPSQKD